MKIVSTAQMRELDRRTIEEYGIPGAELMERAGTGVARWIRELARVRTPPMGFVRCLAGRGSNGGDAVVAARCLASWGLDVEVWLAATAADVRDDARLALERLSGTGVTVREMPAPADWHGAGAALPPRETIFVDGLLGTGTRGAPREPVASAIRCINACAADGAAVVAIDVPSGMDTDSGAAAGDVVRADLTVTMAFPKEGLLKPGALANTGAVEVVPIGIPDELSRPLPTEAELICAADVRGLLPRRPRSAHKGTFGHVLVVGGAPGYPGAVALAGRAAVRSGAGLVSALVPDTVCGVVAGLAPEVMVHAGRSTAQGSLAAGSLQGLPAPLSAFDAVLVGPGLTTEAQGLALVSALLAGVSSRLVLDADALNVCAGHLARVRDAACPVVITPHPGEMGRLLGRPTAEVQADRAGAARCVHEQTGATVILKGAGSLVLGRSRAPAINTTGNPGMATGGSGDVLAGVVAALLAGGLAPVDAARAAVYLHGRAGDRAAWRSSQAGLGAVDVLDELPAAFAGVMAR